MKTVYIAMSADLITPDHVNMIQEARAFGKVVIGLPSDNLRLRLSFGPQDVMKVYGPGR